ncbi:hypothetical protein CVD25_08435 [Bacillus canaveralius]|uniref:Uncharacterized protein n=1 Tax=Bacillus canaveralius TaxID=1403243 RepID=A0A2N5GIB4_9BACI|nr:MULTISPECIES: hypothetical protein [Bacillus]PLR80738.1 hypothetical protein CU635_16935 [Bacillus canaveralius]PLR81728.1 hypothetical protein CVD23_18305 [Bacillus sp. V33-4]PLR98384.1 hypothetical protein CVD25_08435 [Bacillus canaveralius]RSK53888.1 hypothetical protein EJA13_07200 [Bacillus canaveralius]
MSKHYDQDEIDKMLHQIKTYKKIIVSYQENDATQDYLDMKKKLTSLMKERQLEQKRYEKLLKQLQTNSEKLEANEKKYEELTHSYEQKQQEHEEIKAMYEKQKQEYEETKASYEMQKQEYEQFKATSDQQKTGVSLPDHIDTEEITAPSETDGPNMVEDKWPKKQMRTPLDLTRMSRQNGMQTAKQITFRDIQSNLEN